MESSLMKSLVFDVKKETFDKIVRNNGASSCMSPSAYDTAWLAMIPRSNISSRGPMFNKCLNWIVENQKEGGFWGETDDHDLPTIDALPSTLAALLALKTWNLAHHNIQTGLDFIHSNVEVILKNNYESLPRWFILCFPAMIELATAAGLDLVVTPGSRDMIANIFIERQNILEMEKRVDTTSDGYKNNCFPPLVAYLETLPSTYHKFETVQRYLSYDGSLFQSPSATAQAFMVTGNIDCLKYLESIVEEYPNGGVPAKHPVDGDLIKLCLVDHVQGLGLAEQFNEEIEHTLAHVYRNRKDNKNSKLIETNIFQKLFKDALAFRLLRMQGHDVNPGSFCWFLHEPEMVAYMEENSEQLTSTMYSVFRATDLQFPDECEMKEARTFAIRMLQNHNHYDPIINNNKDHNFLISKGFQNMIKYELDVPWTARLDHLNHRKWIEENKTGPLWIGKASFHRFSCLSNNKLLQLAIGNFEFRQSIYKQELEELKGWSKKWRLSELGFGREKTVYCYFAVAAACCRCLPVDSFTRLVLAKAAIIVTVADDFYDMEGSLTELETLTDAVKRWDKTELQGHGKTIFDALDDFVNEIAANNYHLPQERSKVMKKLQHLWRETFVSWMVERDWSLKGYLPSMDEYLATGTISIAAHTIALPATNFLSQPNGTILEYHDITKLLMETSRLVNDTQSYEKEVADGKINIVLLHLKENPDAKIEDSIAYVNQILEMKKKEFLKQVFMDGDMQKPCKQIHLACMKVFQMFFNSSNLFDTEAALMDEIERAIYIPIVRKPKTEPFLKPIPPKIKKQEKSKVFDGFGPIMKHSGITINPLVKQLFSKNSPSFAGWKTTSFPMKFNLCFM